ncbi:hypothetical protein R0J89_21045, partial [Psychrobacter sp. SIMBA_152]
VRILTQHMQGQKNPEFNDLNAILLYQDAYETVSIVQFKANQSLTLTVSGGAELLVLDGTLQEHNDTLEKHSWLRVPVNSEI